MICNKISLQWPTGSREQIQNVKELETDRQRSDGRTDRKTDKQTDRQKDGQTDGRRTTDDKKCELEPFVQVS